MQFKFIPTTDFSKAKNPTQSYGILLNDQNQILLVSKDNRDWNLPGGTIEIGEDSVETLKREVYEEAAVKLDEQSIQPFYYQEVYSDQDELMMSQLRYFARISKIDKFVADPTGQVKYQMFIKIEDLDKYLKWGDTTEYIKNKIKFFVS